ncbi:serine carboxypeptidase II-3 [Gossypium australe]|uniref:Serine carboxypeptidase II-3 n=1 Tax=Gossypium australe TaxID=47621 RepID=A0A5B6WU98_9ROSI|nr:serine carboxypeptidase II-3 [Gossypium australe]
MMELDPFGVEKDGKTLHRNEYAWNKESPARVGFSYSNRTSDYKSSGDELPKIPIPFLFTGSKEFLNTKPGNFSWQERVMQAIMYPSLLTLSSKIINTPIEL